MGRNKKKAEKSLETILREGCVRYESSSDPMIQLLVPKDSKPDILKSIPNMSSPRLCVELITPPLFQNRYIFKKEVPPFQFYFDVKNVEDKWHYGCVLLARNGSILYRKEIKPGHIILDLDPYLEDGDNDFSIMVSHPIYNLHWQHYYSAYLWSDKDVIV